MNPDQFNAPENIDPQELTNILETKGIEDPGAKKMLDRYAEQCEKEADAKADPDDPVATNHSRIECVIKLATIYLKTEKYRNYGRESLEQIFMNEGGGELTSDLADQIVRLLAEYN
jgi:hypothetical protein